MVSSRSALRKARAGCLEAEVAIVPGETWQKTARAASALRRRCRCAQPFASKSASRGHGRVDLPRIHGAIMPSRIIAGKGLCGSGSLGTFGQTFSAWGAE